MIKLVVRDKRFTSLSSNGHEIPLNSGQMPSNSGHVFKKGSNTDSFAFRSWRFEKVHRKARRYYPMGSVKPSLRNDARS
jgi:hypothetical protein